MKNLKSIALSLLLPAILALQAHAQTVNCVTLSTTNSISYPVQTNQIISIVGYDWYDKPQVSGETANGSVLSLNPWTGIGSTSTLSSQTSQLVTGLTNIQVFSGTGGAAWVTIQVTTPSTATIVSNYVPADAVVIPASATGNFQIILESSSDLVNWTAANPGLYGPSSATNRFFRVRAVVQ